jgi:hypothetical protein
VHAVAINKVVAIKVTKVVNKVVAIKETKAGNKAVVMVKITKAKIASKAVMLHSSNLHLLSSQHRSKTTNTSHSSKVVLHHNKIVHHNSKAGLHLSHKMHRKVAHQTLWNQQSTLMTISRSDLRQKNVENFLESRFLAAFLLKK